MKIGMEINEMEYRKTIQRINETKSWVFGFFFKINKIDEVLAMLTKEKRRHK